MINYDYTTKENIEKHNTNQPQIFYPKSRIIGIVLINLKHIT